MSAATELSCSLSELHAEFDAHRGHDVEISGEHITAIAERLNMMRQLATNMEIELTAHRIGEASRDGRAFAEELATLVMADAVANGGNVIRPNFRRQK